MPRGAGSSHPRYGESHDSPAQRMQLPLTREHILPRRTRAGGRGGADNADREERDIRLMWYNEGECGDGGSWCMSGWHHVKGDSSGGLGSSTSHTIAAVGSADGEHATFTCITALVHPQGPAPITIAVLTVYTLPPPDASQQPQAQMQWQPTRWHEKKVLLGQWHPRASITGKDWESIKGGFEQRMVIWNGIGKG
ncbi:hypothetical protein JB92DRAFT_2830309 [Gautieria morchelliformis]|nr:hypothetical protein JB92DRAFT_2830309 [Gautieria morchelliformis]